MSGSPAFPADRALEFDEICNLNKERRRLLLGLERGKHYVVYGKRNVGKTSVLKGVVIPELVKKHKNAFILFADLMGVTSLENIESRIYKAFQKGFAKAKPSEAFLKGLYRALQSLRPSMSLDPVDGPTFSLEVGKGQVPSLDTIFSAIAKLTKQTECLIILDEFQDIHRIPEAEALFRDCFQNLPGSIPIYVAGSKKHILAKIFSKASAPLAGFGEDVEFAEIPYEEYYEYMKPRFRAAAGLSVDLETSTWFQNLLFRIPESIHIVANQMIEIAEREKQHKKVTHELIFAGLKEALDVRQSRFEEYLKRFTEAEQNVLAAIARLEYVKNPSGKDLARHTKLSQRGVSKIMVKLEDEAEIYNSKLGFYLADPLLHFYLRSYR